MAFTLGTNLVYADIIIIYSNVAAVVRVFFTITLGSFVAGAGMRSAESYDLVKFSDIFVNCDLVKTRFSKSQAGADE